MLPNGGPPLLGIPITMGPRRTSSLTAEHLNLFNTFTAITQADRRRRHSDVPHNTPVPSEDASPRAEISLTRPAVPDINHVDLSVKSCSMTISRPKLAAQNVKLVLACRTFGAL